MRNPPPGTNCTAKLGLKQGAGVPPDLGHDAVFLYGGSQCPASGFHQPFVAVPLGTGSSQVATRSCASSKRGLIPTLSASAKKAVRHADGGGVIRCGIGSGQGR